MSSKSMKRLLPSNKASEERPRRPVAFEKYKQKYPEITVREWNEWGEWLIHSFRQLKKKRLSFAEAKAEYLRVGSHVGDSPENNLGNLLDAIKRGDVYSKGEFDGKCFVASFVEDGVWSQRCNVDIRALWPSIQAAMATLANQDANVIEDGVAVWFSALNERTILYKQNDQYVACYTALREKLDMMMAEIDPQQDNPIVQFAKPIAAKSLLVREHVRNIEANLAALAEKYRQNPNFYDVRYVGHSLLNEFGW